MLYKKYLFFIVFLVFFAIGIATLPHYGVNWDTINHLPRGQAYLNYLLYGQKNYSNLPAWNFYWQNPDSLHIDSDTPISQIPRRSLYQSDATTFDWFMLHDGNGHPPISDILSSFFNKVLFSDLRLINDIDAYRVYGIFLAALLVSVVFLVIANQYGIFPGLVSAISLALYPLFWAESHFNTEKDIPQTVFISFMILSFWRGFTQKRNIWIILAGIFAGLAFGTKLNVVFAIFIMLPWVLYFLIKSGFKAHLKQILISPIAPLIGLGIFIYMWPYLWPDPLGRIYGVVKFYKQIGTTTNQLNNGYALSWIIYTTPIITLILSLLGILGALFGKDPKRKSFEILILLWLIVPIARVTMPGSNIYGGVRQIMEYVPAMCMMAGIGTYYLIKAIKSPLIKAVILASFLFMLLTFIKIHPNENVYFNALAGGLSGAKLKNIPSWGNTFGAAYRQGVSYINKNAEKGANVVLAHELLPNIPKIFFRSDIAFQNKSRSGYLQNGEWAITLVYQGTQNRSYYDSYLERFVNPSFVASVDNVAILKVWHNHPSNLKIKAKEFQLDKVKVIRSEEQLLLNLDKDYLLSRLEISYSENNCQPLKQGIVEISNDDKNWQTMPGVLPGYWKISQLGSQPNDGQFIEPFAGEKAKSIRLLLAPSDTCLFNYKQIKVFVFPGGDKLE